MLAPDGNWESPDDALELAFLLAPRQNLFFDELIAALRAELDQLGVPNSLHVGLFPEPRPDRVYVLVPPHEYFTIMHGLIGAPPEVLKRTIFICAEQPNTSFFDSNVELAPRAGAIFDINRGAVRGFERAGIQAHHLQLGWTQGWDHFTEGERDIDVLFIGTRSDRRLAALASYARTFDGRRVELLFSDNALPNWRASESFLIEERKWALLQRSKLVLNLHQGETPYFEWLRILQAISCGAVVVSEDSIDYEPLVPGEHLLMGDAASLHLLCERLLCDEVRLAQIRAAAYDTVRSSLQLSSSLPQLVEHASELARTGPRPNPAHAFFTQPQPDPDELEFFQHRDGPGSLSNGDTNAAWTRRALKDLRLEMLDLRRAITRIEMERTRSTSIPRVELVAKTFSFDGAAPRVSVLTACYNHAQHVTAALDSVAASRDCPFEVIVVDDGSSDGSSGAVAAWMQRHQSTPVVLLRHPVNRGLAAARNAALNYARGEYCFVLDSDNEVFPRCLRRLQFELECNPTAAVAYGTLEMFSGIEPVGLLNTLPWEPRLFRNGNYVDAMAMMRTSVVRDELGGYPTDRRLYGWEDYALWCAVVSAGYGGIRVPEILARYRVSKHSMLSLTNISVTDAYSVLIEANPELMDSIEPPE